MKTIVIALICVAVGYWLVSRLGGSLRKTAQRGADPLAQATVANWHRILEVRENATREQITTAYKRKIAQYHPDKVAQMGTEIRDLAEAKSKLINAAYEMGISRYR